MLRWRAVRIIALRELWVTIRRREFLLVTFGLPLLYLVVGLGVVGATSSAVGEAERSEAARTRTIGWVDHSGLLSRHTLEQGEDDVHGAVYPDDQIGKDAVRRGRVRTLVVVPKDFAESGSVTLYLPARRGSIFRENNAGDRRAYLPVLRRALLAGRAPAPIIERAVEPPDERRLEFDPAANAFTPPNPLQAVSRFAVPYVFSLLLLVSVFFSSSYLVHGIVEEKENRVIEVLLSAASHDELLLGKLIGLGGAGLAQLGLWLVTGGSMGLLASQVARQFGAFAVSPAMIATGCLFFLLGFGFYAALTAGIGSFGTSWRESQQISGMLVFFLVLPLMVMPVFLESPDGALARVLSFLPPTAPIAMMLRVAAGGSSILEVLLSAALLVAAFLFVVRLSARLFRLSLLMYGQRPSVAEVLRWLRDREPSSVAD